MLLARLFFDSVSTLVDVFTVNVPCVPTPSERVKILPQNETFLYLTMPNCAFSRESPSARKLMPTASAEKFTPCGWHRLSLIVPPVQSLPPPSNRPQSFHSE